MGEGVGLEDLEAVEAPAFIGNYCRIAPRASVGPYSVLMPSVTLGDHARTARSVVDSSTSIGRSAVVEGAIVGRACDLRPHARLHEGVAVGDNCTIGEESVVMPGVRIYPFKEVESGSLVDRNLIWESRLSSRLIGLDGVSGRIDVDLTPETALRLGLALGTALDRGDRVVTSRAASASCRLIRRALIAGVNSAGVHATDLQVMPSAVNRHFLKTEGFDAGIHVQPSPNDPEVVQIRIFEPPGTPATPALVKEIDKHFSRQEFRRASWGEVGEISYSARTAETYVQDLVAALDGEAIRKRGFRIVVDYAFSAASLVLPQVLGALDVEAVSSHAYVSERRQAGETATLAESLGQAKRLVEAVGADLGAVLDPARGAHLPDRRQGPRGAGRAGAPALPAPARLGRQAGSPGVPDDGDEPRRAARRGHRARGRADAALALRADAWRRRATGSSSPARSAAASSSRSSSPPTTAWRASASSWSCSRRWNGRSRRSSASFPSRRSSTARSAAPGPARAPSCASSPSARRAWTSTSPTGSRSTTSAAGRRCCPIRTSRSSTSSRRGRRPEDSASLEAEFQGLVEEIVAREDEAEEL